MPRLHRNICGHHHRICSWRAVLPVDMRICAVLAMHARGGRHSSSLETGRHGVVVAVLSRCNLHSTLPMCVPVRSRCGCGCGCCRSSTGQSGQLSCPVGFASAVQPLAIYCMILLLLVRNLLRLDRPIWLPGKFVPKRRSMLSSSLHPTR